MEAWYRVLEQHGIGVTIAVGVSLVAWFLLRHIINNHKDDRKAWQDSLSSQQNMTMNHLTHLNAASESMCQLLQQHDKNSQRNSDDVVRAIDAQTNLLKALYDKP
jgi:negative regulator of sigma E activity